MTVIADILPEIPAPKNKFTQMSKRSCLRGLLEKQRGKCVETLLQYEWQHLYKNY